MRGLSVRFLQPMDFQSIVVEFYRAKDKWVISHGVFNDQFQFIEAKKGM